MNLKLEFDSGVGPTCFRYYLTMAAIIAQFTRARRERAKKKTYETNKCMYQLQPFDQHFDPAVHNQYFVRYDSH